MTTAGSFAEYARSRKSHLARKPANLSFEQAAAVPVSGMTALQGLRDVGGVQPGQRVLVIGAAGGVGSFAVQERSEDLEYLTTLIEQRKVTPAIDRTFPLRDAPEAIRYLAQGHPGGKVVVTI